MKNKFLILLIISTFSTFATAKDYECQIILNGDDVYPDNIILPEPRNHEECLAEAKKLFAKNAKTYSDLYIFTDEAIKKVDLDQEDLKK